MQTAHREARWLAYYGSEKYHWQSTQSNGRTSFYRPLGLVEFAFDADGRYDRGCADMNVQMTLEARSSNSNDELRRRIHLAWTCLRCQHVLLQSRSVSGRTMGLEDLPPVLDMQFVIGAPRSFDEAIKDARKQLVFLEDHFENVDPWDFSMHAQNVSRVIDPDKALAKLFVYPLPRSRNGKNFTIHFLQVAAHQIVDGVAVSCWMRDFVHFLNKSPAELENQIAESFTPAAIAKRLPLPQEALYPPITGNKARQRWFWLLTRILRHVRKPLQAGFPNPLKRLPAKTEPVALPPTYAPVLDYRNTSLLNGFPMAAVVSPKNTKRLHRLCREANTSIGAGCFALAALVMMEFYEKSEPHLPLSARRPFISGFPLNPRAFFDHNVEPDNLMLAFSDGITFPFLPSDLDLDGRIRLLARHAHRQLAVFQKRKKVRPDATGVQYMGSRGAGRMLQIQYILSLERMNARLPRHLQIQPDIQGEYPMRPNMSLQTCGISSVGRRDPVLYRGMYDLDKKDGGNDFVVDFRSNSMSVRPRGGEFLVGCGGSDDTLFMNASVDWTTIDPDLAELWRRRFENILDEEKDTKQSSKL